MRRLAAPFVMVALLAGCGEVPKPFRHEGPPSALARPKLMRGVTVRPVEGRDDGAAIAEAVVKALEPHEIPAIVQSGPAFGHVLEAQPAGDGLQWMLKSPEGETLPIYVHPLHSDPVQARRQAQDTATALSARLTDPDSRPPAHQPPPKRERIKLAAFRGLPGDGDKAMTAATRRALERTGFILADDQPDYTVEGRVAVIPGLPGEDTVVVTWVVTGKDGKQLASIDQEGVVPRGRLASAWGGLARDIAEGGAAGVIEVVAAAARNARP